MINVFLSGGTKSTWQDKVKKEISGCNCFDPREAGKLETMAAIAELERKWLDECHILFFYFEETNPSGLGSAFEVGYCVAKGIPVIFVDEKKTTHSQWIAVHCNEVFHNLDEGISSLKKWIENLLLYE